MDYLNIQCLQSKKSIFIYLQEEEKMELDKEKQDRLVCSLLYHQLDIILNFKYEKVIHNDKYFIYSQQL